MDIEEDPNWFWGIILPKVHFFFFVIPIGDVFNRWGYASVMLAGNKNTGEQETD
jgi:hypothetical protein